jgi:hypothetical protein
MYKAAGYVPAPFRGTIEPLARVKDQWRMVDKLAEQFGPPEMDCAYHVTDFSDTFVPEEDMADDPCFLDPRCDFDCDVDDETYFDDRGCDDVDSKLWSTSTASRLNYASKTLQPGAVFWWDSQPCPQNTGPWFYVIVHDSRLFVLQGHVTEIQVHSQEDLPTCEEFVRALADRLEEKVTLQAW